MRYRIFIAINLPEEIKKKLENYRLKWPELPARWTKKENLHITMIFLGYVLDEELLEICKITKEVASRREAFSINLNKICYGPPKKLPPRMIWAEGEKSTELAELKKDLENSLLDSEGKILKEPETRDYAPHITLARIRKWDWQRIEPEERPQISESISLDFDVCSIDVMESRLKKGGSEYTVLESAPLEKV